jgi:hypothetical protein
MPSEHAECQFVDTLPVLLLDSFEQALSASDYHIAFRLLKTLEKYLIKPETSLAQRIDAVTMLVDAHRRLLERHVSAGNPIVGFRLPEDSVTTRH